MADSNVDLVIDLEKSDDDLVKDIVGVLSKNQKKVEAHGQVDLNFLITKKGENPKPFVYNFNKEDLSTAEKEFVFPEVIKEILKKEFNEKVSKNDKMINYVMEELRKDPYWSERVVNLIKEFKEKA